jgi:hypothetical protein
MIILHLKDADVLSGFSLSNFKSKYISIRYGLSFQFSVQCIFYADVFAQNVLRDMSVEQYGVHIFYI